MKHFLKKIKLIDSLTLEFEITKEEFSEKLKENITKSDLGMFSDMFEMFSSDDNDYKGYVNYDSFEIKKRKRMFERNMNFSKITGKFYQNGRNLTVENEINGFPKGFILFYIFTPIFYIFFISLFFTENNSDGDSFSYFLYFFISIHAFLMLGIPYFMMKKNIKKTKKNLEKDFFFMINKK